MHERHWRTWAAALTMASTLLLAIPSGAVADLIAYWDFDGNPLDRSGRNHHASLQGSAQVTSSGGRFGGALVLSSASDWAEVADHSDFDPGLGSFSIAGWIQTSVGRPRLLHKLGYDGQGGTWRGMPSAFGRMTPQKFVAECRIS